MNRFTCIVHMDQSSQLWASINHSKDRGLGWLKTTSRFLPRTKKSNKKQPPDWKNWPFRLVVEYSIYNACANYKCGLSNNS